MRTGKRPAPPWRRRLVVMVKEPVAGRVKTRLARGLGVGVATGFFRASVQALVRRLTSARRWELVLAVAPDAAVGSRALPVGSARMRQGRGDLGARLLRAMQGAGAGPVVAIGADSPQISRAQIAAAFSRLGSHDAVIGPAHDGGYWLIGLRRPRLTPGVFEGVRWSSAETLSDTLAGLAGRRVAFVGSLSDVDEAGDLAALGRARGRLVLPVG